ncbi:MAG TPA: arginine--tRNA ligase [Gemmatimonadales bacterium]
MTERLRAELDRVAATLGEPIAFTLERPRDPTHGDLSSNLAMQIARRDKTNPRALAEQVVAAFDRVAADVAEVTIAGPGFINFRMAADALADQFAAIIGRGAAYGRSVAADPQRVNIEFVSANPTGPLHVGHGRGAALGDGIAALLEWTGHTVVREFYVNDAGVQINRLAESLWARVQEAVGRPAVVPEGGYHGDYLIEAAAQLLASEGAAFADLPPVDGIARCRSAALAMQRAEQDATLADFRVRFDVTASEQAIYDAGAVEATLARLAEANLTFEQDGALWLRASVLGDDRDRVLRKSDGTYTYLAPDVAYHLGKFSRGFTRAIDVWGADHHGYIPRMQAALTALGIRSGWLDVAIVQLVRVVRAGEEVKMSKRSGDFITLRDLYEETGVDAARYWFLMRRGDSHLTFDIELAKARTDENPVFYVQMAHARMHGIFRSAARAVSDVDGAIELTALTADDLELLRKLTQFPELVSRAARDLEPHQITNYLEDLARVSHGWYQACRVLGEPPAVETARLLLARGTLQVLANGLSLLGISAPDRI